MLHYSVCAESVLQKYPFEERIQQIRKNNFNAIEFWKWNNKDLRRLHELLEENHMKAIAFCVDSEDPEIAAQIAEKALTDPNSKGLCQAVEESIEKAQYLGTKNLIVTVGNRMEGQPEEEQRAIVLANLKRIKDYFEKNEITLLVEPINRQERPGYFMPTVRELLPVIRGVSSDFIKILYDIYHESAEYVFSPESLIADLPYIGHIHAADFPGRGKPGTGQIDFNRVFEELSRNHYEKYIGYEYFSQQL